MRASEFIRRLIRQAFALVLLSAAVSPLPAQLPPPQSVQVYSQPNPIVNQWVPIGPINILPTQRQFFGPDYVSGRVNACVFDPSDTTYRTIYVATSLSGIWETTDGGINWRPISDSIPFSSLTLDGNTLYAGTGDYDGTLKLGQGLYIYRRTGMAPNWLWSRPTIVYSGLLRTTKCIRKIVVSNGRILVALGRDRPLTAILRPTVVFPLGPRPNVNGAVAGDIVYSDDGGATWQSAAISSDWGAGVPPGWISNIVVGGGMGAATRLYASADYDGVYRSTDNGATWTRLRGLDQVPSNGSGKVSWHRFLPLGTVNSFRMDVAVSKLGFTPSQSADTLYAISEYTRRLYKSADNGDTWIDTTNNFPQDDPFSNSGNWLRAYSHFFLQTTTGRATIGGTGGPGQPFDKDVVYVGLNDLLMSPDGGQTWQSAALTGTGLDRTHAGQHALAINPGPFIPLPSPFNPHPNDMLLGNEGGLYRVNYDPNFNSWRYVGLSRNESRDALSSGQVFYRALNVALVNASAHSPIDPNMALVGAQDLAAVRTRERNIIKRGPNGNNITEILGDMTRWASLVFPDRNITGGFPLISPGYLVTADGVIPAGFTQFASVLDRNVGLRVYRTNTAWRDPLEQITESSPSFGDQPLEKPINWLLPLTMDMSDPAFLYAGCQTVSRYQGDTSGGGSWTDNLGSTGLITGSLLVFDREKQINLPLFPLDPNQRRVLSNDYLTALAVSTADNRVVYAGTKNGLLWYSFNQQAFRRIDNRREPVENNFSGYDTTVRVDSATGNLLDISTDGAGNDNDPPNPFVRSIQTYTPGYAIGMNIVPPVVTLAAPLPARTITCVAGSPVNPKRLYVTMGANVDPTVSNGNPNAPGPRIWRCDDITRDILQNVGLPRDRATLWRNISGNLPDSLNINWIVVPPRYDERVLYIATDNGVYRGLTSDYVNYTWTRVSGIDNRGGAIPSLPRQDLRLPSVPISHLAFSPSFGYLYASTLGRGVVATVVDLEPSNPTNAFPLPNPARKLQLYPKLSRFRGNRSQLTARVEIFRPDFPLTQTCAPLEIRTGNLNGALGSNPGWLITDISHRGLYDMYVFVPRFLSQKVSRTLTDDQPISTDVMVAGDVNGDDIIDIADALQMLDLRDYLALIGSFFWQGVEDLDGDRMLTDRDFEILIENFGKVGAKRAGGGPVAP